MQRIVAVGTLVAALGIAAFAESAETEGTDADPPSAAADPPGPPKPPDPKKGPPGPDDGSCDCRAAGAPMAPGLPGPSAAFFAAALIFARSSRKSRRY
jgi:hypothetical protein